MWLPSWTRLRTLSMPDATVPGTHRLRSIRDVLATEGIYVDAAQGTSMLPLIREGLDTIVVTPCSASELVPMDIVLYERESAETDKAYVLHRVVARDGDGVTTLGDNCTWLERVPATRVLGVLSGLYRPASQANVLSAARYRAYVALWCRPWRARMALLAACRGLRHKVGAALAESGLR